jgi:hypothetical protein
MIEPNQIETTTTQTFPDWVTEALDAHEDQTPTAECEIERLRRIGRIAETVLADDFASRIAHDLNACVSAVEAAAWRENSQASGSMELWAQVGLKLAQSALAAEAEARIHRHLRALDLALELELTGAPCLPPPCEEEARLERLRQLARRETGGSRE